jgi:hypothetical protein
MILLMRIKDKSPCISIGDDGKIFIRGTEKNLEIEDEGQQEAATLSSTKEPPNQSRLRNSQ